MAGLAALRRENALGGMEAVNVVRLGELAHQDDVAATLRPFDGVLGAEHDLPLRGAG
jgi:hypothetical protein